MTTDIKQSLLDNLMIEVGAEFSPVRMPLKHLKQMSEGLVVEIGDLLHNEVALTVEGKPLARGELVIVGDKFGVRVTEVSAEREQSKPATIPTLSLPATTPATMDDAPQPVSAGAAANLASATGEALQPQTHPTQAAAAPSEQQAPTAGTNLDDLFGDDDLEDEDDW